ncbi:MAG: hypothetical protein LBR81_01780 [Prevotellaceae bacterium]|jgi:uncharacterized protein YcfL|nr:hypothetical protein [Prevotellaceae bacterium]
MKKLVLIAAVAAVALVSCGKKAETSAVDTLAVDTLASIEEVADSTAMDSVATDSTIVAQ